VIRPPAGLKPKICSQARYNSARIGPKCVTRFIALMVIDEIINQW
jgi:hypothetical protein